jgi:hypothetical protein
MDSEILSNGMYEIVNIYNLHWQWDFKQYGMYEIVNI